MSNNYRELTGREKQRIKKLVTSLCANYDKEYGCLPLDCENGCTAHSAVPKKLAVSRPQHGCVSTGKNSNRCNAFALGKPCAARLF